MTSSRPKAEVQTLVKMLECELDPVFLFEQLAKRQEKNNNANRLLLDSCKIESKQHLKSILLHKAALRIECQQHVDKVQVRIQSLTSNGVNALEHLHDVFDNEKQYQNKLIDTENVGVEIVLDYPNPSTNKQDINEEHRLKNISPIDCLRKINKAFISQNQQPYGVFLAGLFSFDFIGTFEILPKVDQGKNSAPDFVFYLAEELIVIDHELHRSTIYSNIFSGKSAEKNYFEQSRKLEGLSLSILEASQFQSRADCAQTSSHSESKISTKETTVNCDSSDLEYEETVKNLKKEIINGNIFQVVPSRTFSLPCKDSLGSYRNLKLNNPSPYMFYLQDKNFILFGASPESALKFQSNTSSVELYPIAGTRPRGKLDSGQIDNDLDKRMEAELRLDQKEISEHMMLVDLARNDIARISLPGSVQIPRLLEVDRYSQVMHLVSNVIGSLRNELDCFHAYQACMNMGTLTGAPKIKATELIRQVETTRRGSYGGAVGYINGNGDMDTCIIIRSAFCKDDIAYVQAGAGVVYDSDPHSESEETKSKAKAVIYAIEMCHETGRM